MQPAASKAPGNVWSGRAHLPSSEEKICIKKKGHLKAFFDKELYDTLR